MAMGENSVNINLCGRNYRLRSKDPASYVEEVARYVDEKVSELTRDSGLSQSDAIILAALNIADELMKERKIEEDLRGNIKNSLDESAQVQNELSRLKRENFELKNRLGNGNRRG